MKSTEILPHLFRTEHQKMVAVLCRIFGTDYLEVAEDIVSDTFLAASELWGLKGLPKNPTGWLYVTAKHKTLDYLRRNQLFRDKISPQLVYHAEKKVDFNFDLNIDLSEKNIKDSQLSMLFVVCHPCNKPEAQIGLALNLLCGFGADEIATAFLTNREVIYKRLQRAKEQLRKEGIVIEGPSSNQIEERLPTVLMTLYLLFNEGYYSLSQDNNLRRDLCMDAMRLVILLTEHKQTALPSVYALLALMCFHASRFDARINRAGESVLYGDQKPELWEQGLIEKGRQYLNQATKNNMTVSRFHIEAGIAFWHSYPGDYPQKWEQVLQLYNQLLIIEYSPVAALNRTYALAKANGKPAAIKEAEKIALEGNHLYHALLGELYTDVDAEKALWHLQRARKLVKTQAEMALMDRKINQLQKESAS